jgi:hypothetical protein
VWVAIKQFANEFMSAAPAASAAAGALPPALRADQRRFTLRRNKEHRG